MKKESDNLQGFAFGIGILGFLNKIHFHIQILFLIREEGALKKSAIKKRSQGFFGNLPVFIANTGPLERKRGGERPEEMAL